MMRNEAIYPDADAFRPERFMVPTTPEMERKMNPKHYVFGFGRRWVLLCVVSMISLFFNLQFYSLLTHSVTRLCPGNHLIDSSVWLLIASMLATLDISKAVDEHGNTVEPVVKYDNSIFRHVDINISVGID